jgi:hypothetical protein
MRAFPNDVAYRAIAVSRKRRLNALRFAATLLLVGAVWAAPGDAQTTKPTVGPPVRLGAPQRLVPPTQPDTAPAATPSAAPAGVAAAPEGGEPPIVVNSLAPIDPDWAGPLTQDRGGFPLALWQGTPRSLVIALVPRIPVTTSPTLQSLARRLLLSNAVAPAGQDGDGANLVELRVERLIAAGQLAAADALLRNMPKRAESESLERRSVELAFLASNRQAACDRVGGDVRRFKDIWWTRALIACQALAGDNAAASLGIDLLHEQKVAKDEAFDALITMVGGGKAKLDRLPNPSPLHLALLAAAKQPLAGDTLAGASPAVSLAWASSEGAPVAQRIVAGERAAAFGALSVDDLRALYDKVDFTAEERANAVTSAAADKAGRGNALLYATARAETADAARAELLQAMLAQARKADDFALIARIAEPMLLEMKPTPELAWFAGDAARGLIATGHPGEARAWMAIADPGQASALFLLARIALGHDGPAWDGKALGAALADLLKTDGDTGVRQAALALAMLAAFDEPVGPADWAPLAAKLPLTSLDVPGAPVWFDLPSAASGKRLGETVLLALVTLGEGTRLSPQPVRLVHAIAALRGVGLEGDARAVAVEAALAAGL